MNTTTALFLGVALAGTGCKSVFAECSTDADCETLLADNCGGGSVTYASCVEGGCVFDGCSSPIGTPGDGNPNTIFDGECEPIRPDSWENCGQAGRVFGTVAVPSERQAESSPEVHETTITLHGGQQVRVFTGEKVTCEGGVTVEGTLTALPDPTNSRTGPVVTDAAVTCGGPIGDADPVLLPN